MIGRVVHTAVGLASIALLFSGCGDSGRSSSGPASSSSTVAPSPSKGNYDALRLSGALEAERFSTFREMAGSADRVALGQFVEFRDGRTIQGDAAEDVVRMIEGVFAVESNVSGSGAEEVVVQFVSAGGTDEAHRQGLSDLQAAVRAGPAVAFLREKQDDSGGWRLVNSYGLVTASEEYPVDVPLGEVDARPDPEDGMDPRGKFRDLSEFVSSLK